MLLVEFARLTGPGAAREEVLLVLLKHIVSVLVVGGPWPDRRISLRGQVELHVRLRVERSSKFLGSELLNSASDDLVSELTENDCLLSLQLCD